MDVCILSQKCEDYNVIKHINEDMSCIIYFDQSKHLVKDRYDGDGNSLLFKDITTLSIEKEYHIMQNGYYAVRC